MKRFVVSVFLAVFLVAPVGKAGAAGRVALVIGNSAYERVAPLPNPKNDAVDMAAKLEALDFEVVRGLDLDLKRMREVTREFVSKLEGADMALFYYASHGMQVDGKNYLAPIDAELWDAIRESSDPHMFESYLAKYPDGAFAETAREKIARLERPAAPEARAAPEREAAPTDGGIAGQVVESNARYTKYACGEIVDRQSGAAWMIGPDRHMNWFEAKQWVEALNACGRADWRMPATSELAALYSPRQVAGTGIFHQGRYWPAKIDPIFSDVGGGSWVWTGRDMGAEAESFNFNQGLAVHYSKVDSRYSTRAFAVHD